MPEIRLLTSQIQPLPARTSVYFKDLSGQLINGSLVLGYAGKDRFGKSLWLLRRQCGVSFIETTARVLAGRRQHCDHCPSPSKDEKACTKCKRVLPLTAFYKTGDKRRPECFQCCKLANEKSRALKGYKPTYSKHGLKTAHINCWRTWRAMKSRCYTPGAFGYEYYGGRGVKVCERWLGADGFRNFLSDMGDRPEGMTIDRIDVNSDYTPENCRWATLEEQANNTRANINITLDGRTQTLTQWVSEKGLSHSTIAARVYRQGMSPEEALTKDTRRGRLITINGTTLNVSEWAKHFGVSRSEIYKRYVNQ